MAGTPTRDGCAPPPRAWTSWTASWPTPGFLRVHRRYVVNLDRVREVERGRRGRAVCWSWTTGRAHGAGLPTQRRRPCAGRWASEGSAVSDVPYSTCPRGQQGARKRLGISASTGRPTGPPEREQPRLVAGPARPDDPAQARRRHRPHGRGLRLRRRVRDPRPRRVRRGRRGGADDLAGLVARRLRPLRAAHGPDGLARARARTASQDGRGGAGHRHAALRAAEQLARQPQPRQGAPAAVAGEEEVRPQALLGRPDDLRGHPSPWSRWASRPSASPAAGRTSGSPTRPSTGVPSAPGSATSATAASASWTIRWPPPRWA